MNNKKLLEISDYYLPHWTGIVKSVAYMNNAIHTHFDITVLTVNHTAKLPAHEKKNNVEIKRMPVSFSLSRAKISFPLVSELFRAVQKNDIIFINSPSAYMSLAAVVGKLSGKKVVMFHQGDLTLPYSIKNWYIERIFDLSCFITCLFSDRVFCATTDYMKHSLILRYFSDKSFELPILAPLPKKMSLKTQNKRWFRSLTSLKNKGYFILGFSGRFVEEKGFDLLLKAIKKAVKQNSRIHFVYAGELKVSYEQFFEANKKWFDSVKKHITIAGLLDENGMEGFYDRCDAIIIPSRSDCYPTVQVEAMIRQIPIIVTDIPGARVPVQKTKFGIITKSNDVESLIDAISQMINDHQNITKQYSQVTRYFNLNHDTQTVTERLTF